MRFFLIFLICFNLALAEENPPDSQTEEGGQQGTPAGDEGQAATEQSQQETPASEDGEEEANPTEQGQEATPEGGQEETSVTEQGQDTTTQVQVTLAEGQESTLATTLASEATTVFVPPQTQEPTTVFVPPPTPEATTVFVPPQTQEPTTVFVPIEEVTEGRKEQTSVSEQGQAATPPAQDEQEVLVTPVYGPKSTFAQDIPSGGNEGDGGGGSGKPIPTDFFSELTLNLELLKGTRWDLEHFNDEKKLKVYHAIQVLDIIKVDVEQQCIVVDFHFQQRWQAPGLVFPEGLFKKKDPNGTYVATTPEILKSMWSPKSYIPLARDIKISQLGTFPPSSVLIFRNRTIIYAATLNVRLGCQFDFAWFPKDRQTCDLIIESYNVPDTKVEYDWVKGQTPLIVDAGIGLYQYHLQRPVQKSLTKITRWGKGLYYPQVRVQFVFERKLGYVMIQVFIPTILVVILSWFSFWLGLDAIPGRVTLLITCLLSIVTMHSSNRGGVPPVNYIRKMDIWMVTCMLMVFLAIAEFIVVKYMQWQLMQEEKAKQMQKMSTGDTDALISLIMQMKKKLGKQGYNTRTFPGGFTHPYLEFYRKAAAAGGNGNVGSNGDHITEYRIAVVLQDNELIIPTETVNLHPPPPPMFHPGNGKVWPYGMAGPQFQPIQKPETPSWMKVDKASRVLFPLAFFIFNCVYWPVLLSY